MSRFLRGHAIRPCNATRQDVALASDELGPLERDSAVRKYACCLRHLAKTNENLSASTCDSSHPACLWREVVTTEVPNYADGNRCRLFFLEL